MADDAKDTIRKTASEVPFAYYDLIARAIPGTLLVLALMWLNGYFDTGGRLELSKALNMSTGFAGVLLIVLLGAGYSMGMLVTGSIGGLIYMTAGKIVWKGILSRPEYKQQIEEFRSTRGADFALVGGEQTEPKVDFYRVERVLDDSLRSRNQLAAQILPKMRAEAGLCCNLLAVLLVLLILLLVRDPGRIDWIAVLIGFLLLIWAVGTRYRGFVLRQLSFLKEVGPGK